MLPIALAAGLAGVRDRRREARRPDRPAVYVFGLTLAAAVVAFLARGAARSSGRQIGFLVAWHLIALGILLLTNWPASRGARHYLPTRASILLSVIFAIAVYALSFVVRSARSPASPTPSSRPGTSRGEAALRLSFRMQERFIAHGLLYVLLVINIAQVLATVLLNHVTTASTPRSSSAPRRPLDRAPVFHHRRLLWVILAVLRAHLTQFTHPKRWRTWMTKRMTNHWLDRGGHYRMRLKAARPTTPTSASPKTSACSPRTRWA